jgi:hypothetical protein
VKEAAAMTTNITDAHRKAFEPLRDGSYTNFALFSCFVNGQPAAAIVAINPDGGEYDITPLFVSVTAGMALTDHDGREPHGPTPAGAG